MAAQPEPSVTAAEPAVIRHRALQMRLAARQRVGRSRQTHARAIMQSAARVRSSPRQGQGPDHQLAGSSLTQLLQPLLMPAATPADAGSAGTNGELALVRPLPIRASGWGLSGSLASIRREVADIYQTLQGTGAGHLRLVGSDQPTPGPSTPQPSSPSPPSRSG